MDRFVHSENVTRYRKLIAISENDPARDEARHQTLLKLLADELAKDKQPQEREATCRMLDPARSARPSLGSKLHLRKTGRTKRE